MATWDDVLCGENFMNGRCFSLAVCIIPAHFFLTFACAYYAGKHREESFSFLSQPKLLQLRIVITIFLLLQLAIKLTLLELVFPKKRLFYIDYAVVVVESMCWACVLVYLCTFRRFHLRSERQVVVNVCYALCFAVGVLNFRYMFDGNDHRVEMYAEIFKLVMELTYLFTLVFRLPRVESRHSEFASFSETEPLLSSSGSSSYVGFHEERDLASLGTAEEGNFISRLLLFWVEPLMRKGIYLKISSTGDLFDLPEPLQAFSVHHKFNNSLRLQKPDGPSNDDANSSFSLIKCLHTSFGIEYYLLGVLKLLSDSFTFVGPVLLNLLVSFLENDKTKKPTGYYFAVGLMMVTLFGALTNTHYSYFISRISLKIRAALICSIYQKSLYVTRTVLSKFTTGEILNFMSTDTDRVVNFCQSFHQFWSLPVQVAIALYLLYQQIGYSFLVGVLFAVLMIPLNQCLTRKIGRYSLLMMEQKDKRIKLMNEVLSGIKVVKMHSWENAFFRKINAIRQKEMKHLKKRKYLDAFCVFFWATTPVIISFLSFTAYVLQGNILTASRIFTSITLFNILIVPLNAFPWVLNGLVEAYISLRRIQGFLKLPELSLEKYYSEPTQSTMKLEMSEAKFTHTHSSSRNKVIDKPVSDLEISSDNRNSEEEWNLGPLNLNVAEGLLVCIIGKVGSGKSTLLSSILGDVNKVSGSVRVTSSDWAEGIGLVAQEPWIQQTTIRDNILFGKPLDSLRYRSVLEACALFDDLKIFPHGDRTEVGEKGITLSGGQKARIALARAAYQDVDLLLLDDPLSAVDAHVAEHIFHHCILGLLKKKTQILCTHRMNVVEKADVVVLLEDGKISKIGLHGSLSQVVSRLSFLPEKEKEQEDIILDSELIEDSLVENQLSVDLFSSDQLIQEEEKHTGAVKLEVCKLYWNAIGTLLSLVVLCSCFLMQASKTISDWWLSYWISHGSGNVTSVLTEGHMSRLLSNIKGHDIVFYLSIYGGLAAANSAFTLIRAFSFAYSGIKAARTLHDRLKSCIVKAQMDFFCTTPLGRILNRFSTDVYNIDDSLPFMLNILLAQTYALIGCLAVTVYSLPLVIVVLLPLAALYYNLQRYYRYTSRELKRISSVTLSPIYAHFSETLGGQLTIRAFAATSRFIQENICKVDNNQQAMFAMFAASQWLNLRLQLIAVVFVSSIAAIGLLQHQFGTTDPGLVGLALSYALSVTGLLNGFVTSFTETEKEMVSVERAMQYIEGVPVESSEGLEETSYSWPSHGVVTFRDVCFQYNELAPYALQNIYFETKRAEKLGIVGRTGSGKSSLIQVLFRMVNMNKGQIFIDGVDISKLSLETLRSRLSVVPQDPFLFTGTIRDNLDPNGIYSDSSIWDALTSCHILDRIVEFGGLDAVVEEKGSNFSAGERQLLCLARSLLHRTKVLCLDEATASIDQHTDALVQLTIRMAFKRTTIFIIAHRMETVMCCDRVMVMSKGRIVELDKPSVLLSDSNSEFYKLVYAE